MNRAGVNGSKRETLAIGEIRVGKVTDDPTNLRRIAGGRIPPAVIDRYVMQYLLKTDAQMQNKQSLPQFNAGVLEDKKLFLCFRRRTDEGYVQHRSWTD